MNKMYLCVCELFHQKTIMTPISSAAFADTKPHYELLDGLRGVAALMIIWYHVFEGFATSPMDQGFNHGYLAVDFFFVLSGFVIGYAYDDRWKTMSVKDFFKRRLVRLHPMVVFGALFGVITFCMQGCVKWDGSSVAFSSVMVALLINLFMLPAFPHTTPEIRGNGEMFPLNGPNWSLFFEYIGNIFYALFLHKLPTKALGGVVLLSGLGLASFALFGLSGYGTIGVGWTMADYNFPGGLLRMLFAYSMGMFLARIFRPRPIKGAFGIASVAIIAMVIVPYIGDGQSPWMNGIYDTVCALFVLPLLVYIGACGKPTSSTSALCHFLGDISYPLYMVHYPIMYLFYAWLWKEGLTFAETWPVAVGLFFGNIALAYIVLKVYDEPVRKWLGKKFIHK